MLKPALYLEDFSVTGVSDHYKNAVLLTLN